MAKSRKAPPTDYLFVVARIEYGSYTVPARRIFEALAQAERWYFPSYASYRSALDKGDRVLLYLAGPGHRHFVGQARLAGRVRGLQEPDRELLEQLGLTDFELAVDLGKVIIWEEAVPFSPLVGTLGFIKDKRYPGHYLRHGVVRLLPGDFEAILRARDAAGGKKT